MGSLSLFKSSKFQMSQSCQKLKIVPVIAHTVTNKAEDIRTGAVSIEENQQLQPIIKKAEASYCLCKKQIQMTITDQSNRNKQQPYCFIMECMRCNNVVGGKLIYAAGPASLSSPPSVLSIRSSNAICALER